MNELRKIISKFYSVKNSSFHNCSGQLPDLLAFSDTQVNDRSPVPSLDSFHDFEFTPTPTGAGGVGFYLRETLDYSLCHDLKLNGLNFCEDIWLKIKNIECKL